MLQPIKACFLHSFLHPFILAFIYFFSEEWHECAKREIFEETGLTVKNVGFAAVVNSVILKEEYHYITIFMKTEIDTENGIKEPVNTEPDKCEGVLRF